MVLQKDHNHFINLSIFMNYKIGYPSAILKNFVKSYWSLNSRLGDQSERSQRIIPSGLPEIIFYLGDRPKKPSSKTSASEISFISGQLTTFHDIKVSGILEVFAISFKPWGLSAFFNIPLNDLSGGDIPLNFLIKEEASKLEEDLVSGKTFLNRIAIAENFLIEKLSYDRNRFETIDRIKNSIELLNNRKEIISIDTLASNSCYSRKQFERVFSEVVGTTPKQFIRIVRFQKAINQKALYKDLNFTELAYACDYYDQSHMVNEFKRLAGMSPKKFFNEGTSYSDYFQP